MPAEPVISSYYREGVLHFIINCLIKYVGYSNECYFVGWSKIIIVKLTHLFDSKKTAKFNWAYIDEGFEPGPFGSILSTWIPSSDRNFSHIVKWISPIKSLLPAGLPKHKNKLLTELYSWVNKFFDVFDPGNRLDSVQFSLYVLSYPHKSE